MSPDENALIRAPDNPALARLCQKLAERASALDISGNWPGEQMQMLAAAGVHRWFLPAEWGGFDWSEAELVEGYLALGSACLTTTFVLTQSSGAARRISESGNFALKQHWLPRLASGDAMATLGISHLTTSRRHLAKPVLQATEKPAAGYVLNGFSPWVTGAAHADVVVTGATLGDGRQILLAVPTSLPGVIADPPAKLVALGGSHTGALRCSDVVVAHENLLAGPNENVMAQGSGSKTGGLQTSTLAVGLAAAALGFLDAEAVARENLQQPAEALREEHAALRDDLLAAARGVPSCSGDELRTRANSLALRATQAALTAAKGSGFVVGHPAGRWCREALFFLVWSCPQPVAQAALCELAGLE